MLYLKKPAYKGKRFLTIDGSYLIKMKTGNKFYPILTLAVLTVLGIIISLNISKDIFGPDQAVAALFWITMVYLWIRLLNMPVEISIKDNRIFFTDYLSNIKYMLIADIISIEKKKSDIIVFSKSNKVKFQSSFDSLNELFEELKKKNSEIRITGFDH
jgi:hypothetical protein